MPGARTTLLMVGAEDWPPGLTESLTELGQLRAEQVRVDSADALLSWLHARMDLLAESPPQRLFMLLRAEFETADTMLRRIRATRRLRHLPILAWPQHADGDAARALVLAGANAVLPPGVASADAAVACHGISRFWLRRAEMPAQCNPCGSCGRGDNIPHSCRGSA